MSKLITPADFYTGKTQTIKNVAAYFKDNFAYNLELAQKQDKQKSRKEIPSIHGMDLKRLMCMDCVVDTYSYRLFNCLGWKNISYHTSLTNLSQLNIN